jgi:hypothetical protein
MIKTVGVWFPNPDNINVETVGVWFPNPNNKE